MIDLTIIIGDRRSGKTRVAIERARASGKPFRVMVRHGAVSHTRTTFPGVSVHSIRHHEIAKCGAGVFVLDDAPEHEIARYLAPVRAVIWTGPIPSTIDQWKWIDKAAELGAALVQVREARAVWVISSGSGLRSRS